ncbi:hypothetical protein MU516_15490 [Paracoccus sp. YLB-12]|uniref:Uncharacterized protein n=1 Tax=Paracoccus maritimus TaxID=2933292 RepID=A0ABT2KCJ6_9RHOB|nr:hypothetical protein [Paracoccus sp. YLB-12]MCT4334268.1 hypothetical protein [Paracoccus sp. YLB-12]
MDFTQFDSRAGAETAGRLHLRHPATGIPLYADEAHEQPCIVLVKGTEARSAQAAMRAARQAKLAGGKTGEDADSTLEDPRPDDRCDRRVRDGRRHPARDDHRSHRRGDPRRDARADRDGFGP